VIYSYQNFSVAELILRLYYARGMSMSTVDWTAASSPEGPPAKAEGLRERKKRLMRQQRSDTATEMFLERGFRRARARR